MLCKRVVPKQTNVKYAAMWDGNPKSTAMLIILVQRKYPLDFVVLLPECMYDCDPTDLILMKKYLDNNSIEYKKLYASSHSKFSRINCKHMTGEVYKQMKCHIVQYVPTVKWERCTNLPCGYYITSRYPLVESSMDTKDCKALISNMGFVSRLGGIYHCQRDLDQLK